MRDTWHHPDAPLGGIGLLLMGGGARTAYQAGVVAAIGELIEGGPASPFDKVAGTSAGGYSSGWLDWYLHGARWVSWLAVPRLMRSRPESLLDNAPLVETLHELIDPAAIEAGLSAGTLDYFAVTASSYTSGRHVTFY